MKKNRYLLFIIYSGGQEISSLGYFLSELNCSSWFFEEPILGFNTKHLSQFGPAPNFPFKSS